MDKKAQEITLENFKQPDASGSQTEKQKRAAKARLWWARRDSNPNLYCEPLRPMHRIYNTFCNTWQQ